MYLMHWISNKMKNISAFGGFNAYSKSIRQKHKETNEKEQLKLPEIKRQISIDLYNKTNRGCMSEKK